MYNKSIEAPFQHKILEPWDQKYCNAPEKLGIETKERYENIIKGESYRSIFNDYYFYFNPEDSSDKQNNTMKILQCDHDKLQNGSIISSKKIINEDFNQYTSLSKGIVAVLQNSQPITDNRQDNQIVNKIEGNSPGEIKVMTNIESKFSKIKQLSSSGSANNVLRQYRVSGGGSININSLSILSKNTSIVSNNDKSLVGASVNSNSSTSTSNPLGMRKTSSIHYVGN